MYFIIYSKSVRDLRILEGQRGLQGNLGGKFYILFLGIYRIPWGNLDTPFLIWNKGLQNISTQHKFEYPLQFK